MKLPISKIKKYILRHFFKPGLYKYKNYEEYRKTQIKGNIKKINKVWATEKNIKILSQYIKKTIHDPKFGICHGTRRGKEQEWFRKHLKINVIGTEISPTSKEFPHTIQWDFHETKPEWTNNVDFIYSNSFDHSYKPKECLDTWMKCIQPKGICIIEWSTFNQTSTKLDPFGASKEEYKKLISNNYKIKDILKGQGTGWDKQEESTFFIIKHK